MLEVIEFAGAFSGGALVTLIIMHERFERRVANAYKKKEIIMGSDQAYVVITTAEEIDYIIAAERCRRRDLESRRYVV